MSARSLVLASASPRRRELLTSLGRAFLIAPAELDESMLPGEKPHAHALRLASAKARHVAGEVPPGAIVIGADTIVIDRGQVLGKPADAAQATAFLRALRGRVHEVATAVAVVDTVDGRLLADLERTFVWMRAYSDSEIEAYVASGDPLDKAGGYAIQSTSFRPVAAIHGSHSNVVGLPLSLVTRLLARLEDGAPDEV